MEGVPHAHFDKHHTHIFPKTHLNQSANGFQEEWNLLQGTSALRRKQQEVLGESRDALSPPAQSSESGPWMPHGPQYMGLPMMLKANLRVRDLTLMSLRMQNLMKEPRTSEQQSPGNSAWVLLAFSNSVCFFPVLCFFKADSTIP